MPASPKFAIFFFAALSRGELSARARLMSSSSEDDDRCRRKKRHKHERKREHAHKRKHHHGRRGSAVAGRSALFREKTRTFVSVDPGPATLMNSWWARYFAIRADISRSGPIFRDTPDISRCGSIFCEVPYTVRSPAAIACDFFFARRHVRRHRPGQEARPVPIFPIFCDFSRSGPIIRDRSRYSRDPPIAADSVTICWNNTREHH